MSGPHPPISPRPAIMPPASPPNRPTHLQPIEGAPYRISSNLPLTPKSNLGPALRTALLKTESDISVSLQQEAAQQQQQQQSDADNIKVVVRLRPLFPAELTKSATNVCQVSEDFSSLKVVVPGPNGATMQRDFAFHACLGSETSQADVMALCGIHQLLDAALAGYHVTIFAYGQTGSGKTFTMSGKEDVISDDAYNGHDQDGIISRAVQYLFHQVHTRKDAKYSLKASYLEIYNEGVFDLVNFNPKAKSLPVKWDASYGFYVQGLKVVPCSQQRTMMEVIRTGMKHRKVASHRLNSESSRSHAIMTIYCDATPTDPTSYDYGTMRYGKLSFVDLAGSERVKDSMSEGTMLKETININKSLSVLGKVISTLAEHDAAGTTAHVPYRDSKLTKLLMDSLGGSALTLMIACCSPSSLQVEETLSTLSYATRAKNIHNRPTVQYDPREAQIALLRREIELLRQENTLLKEQLRAGGGSAHTSVPTTPDGAQHMASKLRPVIGIPAHSGSPGGSASSSPGAGPGQQRSQSVEQGFDDNLQRSSSLPMAAAPPGGQQQLRSSLNEAELRSNIARQALNSTGGSPIGNQELLRRLRETQALLIKFSEENGRLARDNDKLQAGRNVLSAEHATVLDEIDLLRGKLSQLERNVLSAAAMATSTTGDDGKTQQQLQLQPQQMQQQQQRISGGVGALAAAASGQGIDIQSLLASLGLGEDAVANLSAVGAGPQERLMGDAGQQVQQEWDGNVTPAAEIDTFANSRYSQQQSNLSARLDYSSGGGSIVPDVLPSRQRILSPPPGKAATAVAGMQKAGSRLSSANLASTAKSVINRTPLNNRSQLDPAGDDSIIVANGAGLAMLLGPTGGDSSSNVNSSSTAASGSIAPGQLGSPVLMHSSSTQKSFTAALPPALKVPGSDTSFGGSLSPRIVSFVDRQPAADVYSQLPSSATSTSSAIKRPLPYKPGERGGVQAVKK